MLMPLQASIFIYVIIYYISESKENTKENYADDILYCGFEVEDDGI